MELECIRPKQIVKNTIIHLFTKCLNMEFLLLSCNDNQQLPNLVSFLEIGLMKTTYSKRRLLKIEILLAETKMQDFELQIARIINALSTSKIESFMLVIFFEPDIDKEKYRNQMVTFYQQRYLAQVTDEKDEDGNIQIVISNKQCKISGYEYYPDI